MIKKLNIKLKRPDENGIFHNTRHDVAVLAEACNVLIDKVNELTDEVNRLSLKVGDTK